MSESELKSQFLALVEQQGLNFASVISWFHEIQEAKEPMAPAFIKAAQEQAVEGEIEVDENAQLSFSSDQGAYCMAWLWVSNEEAGLPEDWSSKAA